MMSSGSDAGMVAASVLVWTTMGSVVGSLVLYGLGASLGRDRLYRAVDRIPLLRAEDLDKAEGWFVRYGRRAVFFGRFVPIVRSLVSVPAGVVGMPLARFVLYTAAGSGIWNTSLVVAGYGLGENWTAVQAYVGVYSRTVLLVAAVLAVVLLVVRVSGRWSSNAS